MANGIFGGRRRRDEQIDELVDKATKAEPERNGNGNGRHNGNGRRNGNGYVNGNGSRKRNNWPY